MEYDISTDPLPLIVLQCSSCRSIVGDTNEFVCLATLKDLKFVVVKAATGVTVDRIAQRTLINNLEPLSHFSICCSGCGSAVGRMYTSLPTPLASLKDAFAMEIGKCSSYQVGSAEVRVEGQEGPSEIDATASELALAYPQQQPGAVLLGNGGQQINAAADSAAARIEALEAELVKMQHIILLHDTQLQGLPGYQSLPTDEEQPAAAGGVY